MAFIYLEKMTDSICNTLNFNRFNRTSVFLTVDVGAGDDRPLAAGGWVSTPNRPSSQRTDAWRLVGLTYEPIGPLSVNQRSCDSCTMNAAFDPAPLCFRHSEQWH
jgi:hypothetical protein